jgi:hypothetical protein
VRHSLEGGEAVQCSEVVGSALEVRTARVDVGVYTSHDRAVLPACLPSVRLACVRTDGPDPADLPIPIARHVHQLICRLRRIPYLNMHELALPHFHELALKLKVLTTTLNRVGELRRMELLPAILPKYGFC